MLGAGLRFGAHLYSLLCVDADDRPCRPFELAIDPNLTVVINVGLEPYAVIAQRQAIHLLGQLDGNPIPSKGKTLGNTSANIGTQVPSRIIEVSQTGRR